MNKSDEDMRVTKRAALQMSHFIVFIFVCALVGTSTAQNYQSQISRIDQQIFDCKVKIQELERREEKMLEELRHGLFCSKCKRSKSEIERSGVSFGQHLQDVKGEVIANPELIVEKKRFYEDQIAALQQRIAELEKMKGQLANSTQQQANLERQRATAAQRQRQLETQRQQMAELQRKRDQIVQKGVTKAESYRQAGQAASDALQQAGSVILEQMKKNQEESAQRREDERVEREQERIDKQMAALDEKMKAAEQEQSAPQRDASVGGDSAYGAYVPEPIALREPPSERDYLRGTASLDDATERQLAMMREKSPDRSIFDVASAQPTRPENRLSDYFKIDPETTREPPANGTEDEGENSGRKIRESARRALDSVWESTREEVKPRTTALLNTIFEQAATDGDIAPVAAARDQAKDEVIQGVKTRFYEWFKSKQLILNGRSLNELSEDERQDYEIKYDVLKHMWYIFRHNPKGATEAGYNLENRLGDNLKKLGDLTDDHTVK